MTKIWSIQEFKANVAEAIRQAEQEPQIITRHGKTVGVLYGPDHVPQPKARTALEALRGNFDFSRMPDDDWLERDRTPYVERNPFDWLEEEDNT